MLRLIAISALAVITLTSQLPNSETLPTAELCHDAMPSITIAANSKQDATNFVTYFKHQNNESAKQVLLNKNIKKGLPYYDVIDSYKDKTLTLKPLSQPSPPQGLFWNTVGDVEQFAFFRGNLWTLYQKPILFDVSTTDLEAIDKSKFWRHTAFH